ncbi:uncharacterized protein LOC123524238 [Mercenaria mercenaria]|uniref:uncharacterized protein LOC123524238 n=1 Tax=Mercenaria mercenaria TaxID=6596 RepID=UPI001E1D2EB6|nr:uncharacterized protein LOC123524238 [Mercenaria mercenaria]XP_045158224.1 uncharacterized protein LOC123524238 [Mercenaria mercenaria]XP_045158226.1 uncharacterized protein LOC123524238 [Mercenaria mercenaria]XP_045158227.1 uncharacterized protein LOC123524238 [Mercenaria mercenaria]
MAYHNRYDEKWTVQWIVTIVVVLVVYFVWKKRHLKTKNIEKKELNTKESQTDKCALLSSKTQTDKSILVSTKTQTVKSKWFTERLTEFDTRDLGSDEAFDFVCEICDAGKEAVGFCLWCEQYLCLKCCKHHEKIRFSENHVLKGKEDYLFSKKQVSMFGRKLVPVYAKDISNFFTILIDGKEGNFVPILQEGGRLCTLSTSSNYKRYHNITAEKYCAHKYQDPETVFIIGKNKCIMRFCTKHKIAVNCFVTLTNCTSVTKFNHGLAVAQYISTRYSVPSWSIQFLDFKGNINSYVVYDAEGRPLFKNIYSLTADNTGNLLYVCDQTSCTVSVFGTNGKLVRKIAFNLDVYPRELVFDSEDNIYLACAYQVIQIDALCKTFRVLFTLNVDRKNPKGNAITHIRFNKWTNKITIVENAKTVTTFSFLPEYCRKSSIHKFPI